MELKEATKFHRFAVLWQTCNPFVSPFEEQFRQESGILELVVSMGLAGACLRRGGHRGLTLIETLLALIMLSLLIVGVLGLLGSLLVASTKSTDSTAGTLMAQYLFERASSVGPPEADPDTGAQEQSGEEQLLTHEEHRAVDFQYKMVWTKIGEAETYTLGTATEESQFGPELFHVEVQVWWMVENPEDGRLEGGGRRTVTLERLISIEESLAEEE